MMNEMDLVNDLMMFFRIGYSIVLGCVVLLLLVIVVCILMQIYGR